MGRGGGKCWWTWEKNLGLVWCCARLFFLFFLSSGGEGSRKYGCLIPCVVQWLCGVWQQYECLIPFVVWWQWHGILLPLYGGMHSPNLSLPLPRLQHHWNLPWYCNSSKQILVWDSLTETVSLPSVMPFVLKCASLCTEEVGSRRQVLAAMLAGKKWTHRPLQGKGAGLAARALVFCPFTGPFSSLCFQNAHVNSWPASRQVLMGSWQHLPALSSQRTVPQTLVPDALTATADTWRQSLMVSVGRICSVPAVRV